MSTIKVNAIQNTSGVEQFLAKAWVNFNGTGTVAIRASGNVTSITDNGVGDYTVNFATALADANHAVSIQAQEASAGSNYYGYETFLSTIAAGNVRFRHTQNFAGGTVGLDSSQCHVHVFR